MAFHGHTPGRKAGIRHALELRTAPDFTPAPPPAKAQGDWSSNRLLAAPTCLQGRACGDFRCPAKACLRGAHNIAVRTLETVVRGWDRQYLLTYARARTPAEAEAGARAAMSALTALASELQWVAVVEPHEWSATFHCHALLGFRPGQRGLDTVRPARVKAALATALAATAQDARASLHLAPGAPGAAPLGAVEAGPRYLLKNAGIQGLNYGMARARVAAHLALNSGGSLRTSRAFFTSSCFFASAVGAGDSPKRRARREGGFYRYLVFALGHARGVDYRTAYGMALNAGARDSRALESLVLRETCAAFQRGTRLAPTFTPNRAMAASCGPLETCPTAPLLGHLRPTGRLRVPLGRHAPFTPTACPTAPPCPRATPTHSRLVCRFHRRTQHLPRAPPLISLCFFTSFLLGIEGNTPENHPTSHTR